MRRILLLIGCLAAVSSPACGGGGTELAAYEIVSRAATTTTETGRARMAMTTEAGSLTMEAEGLIDFERQLSTLSMEVPGADGGITIVADGTTMYMRMPPEAREALGIPTEWASFDLARLADAQGFDLGQLTGGADSDPTEMLQALRGASDDVEEVGTEEVRGVETTHYRGTMDLRRAAQQSGANAEQIEKLIDLVGKDTMPAHVWVDDEGLARRMRSELPMPIGGDAEMTLELFDYGTDEKIVVPPADQVTDVTDKALAEAEAAGLGD